jgi:hypothetical protein
MRVVELSRSASIKTAVAMVFVPQSNHRFHSRVHFFLCVCGFFFHN